MPEEMRGNPGLALPLCTSKSGYVRVLSPFGNQLVTLTLSGAQIKELLEQQWRSDKLQVILHGSQGFAYTWDSTRPLGDRVVPGSLKLNGKPIEPGDRLRVAVNNYLADGGDGFTVLASGVDRRFGKFDVAALDAYFGLHSPLSPGPLDRINRLH
jgi:5'-nucleotidase